MSQHRRCSTWCIVMGGGVHCKPCGMRPPHFRDFQSANNRIFKMKPDTLQVIQSEPFYPLVWGHLTYLTFERVTFSPSQKGHDLNHQAWILKEGKPSLRLHFWGIACVASLYFMSGNPFILNSQTVTKRSVNGKHDIIVEHLSNLQNVVLPVRL